MATTTEAPCLLAIETSTRCTSAALVRGDLVLALAEGAPGVATAESLLPCVDQVLCTAGVDLAAVDAFAVAVGPGSFTSLRIGVATVKGFAFESELPAIAVSSLAALALAAAPGEGPVLSVLDARRGEVYAAAYSEPADGNCDALAEGLYAPGDFVGRWPTCRVVGDATDSVGDALREALGDGARFLKGRFPHAREVARLAKSRLARGERTSAADLAPRYVRRAQAEVVRTGLSTEREGSL